MLLGKRVRHVATGRFATCALTEDGLVYCWGLDHLGQAGPHGIEMCGEQLCVTRPDQPVMDQPATMLAAGRDETCALRDAGELWCWGQYNWRTPDMSFCKIGDPNCLGTPTQVPELTGLTQLAIGEVDACAASADTIYCWGHGYLNSVDSDFDRHPTRPSSVARSVVDLAVTDDFECGLSAEGSVWCWGDLALGPEPVPMEAPVQLQGADDVIQIAGGPRQLCGVRREGGVVCWDSFRRQRLEPSEELIWLTQAHR